MLWGLANSNCSCPWQSSSLSRIHKDPLRAEAYPIPILRNYKIQLLRHIRVSNSEEEPVLQEPVLSDPSLPPPPTSDVSITNDDDDIFSICKTLTQLWAIVLPLGYAGVPLAAQALSGIPEGQSYAAAAVEVAVLQGVLTLLNSKGFTFKFDLLSEPKSVLIGVAAGSTALLVNQLFFTSGGTDVTGDVSAVLANSGFIASAALFIASTLLAPATEEIIYRGYFLGSLQKIGTPTPVAVVVSALAFSMAHLEPAAFLQLTIVGLALGSAAVVSEGNLAAPFIAHALYNSALFVNLLFLR